jgi:hypothetical protein
VLRAGLGVRACLLVSSRKLRAISGRIRNSDDAVEFRTIYERTRTKEEEHARGEI